MRKAKSRITQYGGGIIRLTEYGTFRAEINSDSERVRQTFKRIEEAKSWIDTTQIASMNGVDSLGPIDYRDAVAMRRLIPAEYTLAEVGKFFMERLPNKRIILNDAIEEYFEHKYSLGLREQSLRGSRQHVLRLAKNLGTKTMESITLDDINEVIRVEGIGSKSVKNFRSDWGALFNWAKKRGYISENVVEQVVAPKVDSEEPSTVTPEQAKAILSAASEIDASYVPYFTLGLFCGIRPTELSLLDSDCLTREEGHVFVGSSRAKTRESRFVTLTDNANEWLSRYPIQGEVCPGGIIKAQATLTIVSKASGVNPWPRDVMRHSFASYHLALHKDASKTAHELGHRRDQQMLFRHYRALVSSEAAVRYFSIVP